MLTVTPGAANADSYATIADADAYHTARGNTAWTGADSVKEAALRRASQWLDGAFADRWPGQRRFDRVQALSWPRSWAVDREGWTIDADTIPREIVQATCEAALRELVTPGSLSPDVTLLGRVKSETVGPLSVTYDGAGGVSAAVPVLTVVEGILSRIIRTGRTTTVLRA